VTSSGSHEAGCRALLGGVVTGFSEEEDRRQRVQGRDATEGGRQKQGSRGWPSATHCLKIIDFLAHHLPKKTIKTGR
jgi:hypothetical protein